MEMTVRRRTNVVFLVTVHFNDGMERFHAQTILFTNETIALYQYTDTYAGGHVLYSSNVELETNFGSRLFSSQKDARYLWQVHC